MSYCRFGDGDVYMFPAQWGIVCCQCRIKHEDNDPDFPNSLEALKHLHEHSMVGSDVPQHAIDRLKDEVRDFVGVEKGGGVLCHQ